MRSRERCAVLVVALLSLGAAGAAVGPPAAPNDWAPVWAAVREWLAADPRPASETVQEAAAGLDDPARRELLAALLGDDAARAAFAQRVAALPGGAAWPFDVQESWLAGRVLDGPARSRALLVALDGTAQLEGAELQLAYEAGVDAASDLRLPEAAALQRAVHTRAGAEWSASNLALTLQLAGDYDGAERVLAEQSARASSAALASQRGLNLLSAGRLDEALEHLQSASAAGSIDGVLIRARLDLSEGRYDAARAGFGGLLEATDRTRAPGAWALRGWGTALVESAPASPRGGARRSVP